MNQHRDQGIRKQLSDIVKKHWVRFTATPRKKTNGNDDLFSDKIHERLAISEHEADRQLHEFMIQNRHWSDLSRH